MDSDSASTSFRYMDGRSKLGVNIRTEKKHIMYEARRGSGGITYPKDAW